MDAITLENKVYEIFHPTFTLDKAKGIIVDLTKNNFDKIKTKYCNDDFPGDHLAFYMSAPIGEYAGKGTTVFFYVWDYEEIGAYGAIIGKGTICEVLNIKNDDPLAWEKNDEKRSSFTDREGVIKHCAKRILKIKFKDLEFTFNKENYFTFENMITDLYNIDLTPGDWNSLLEFFRPDSVGHMYLTSDQVTLVNKKLQTDKFIIPHENYYDEMLQIANKGALELFGPYIYRMTTRKKQPCSLIFFDIDHFKPINDKYSHDAGDAVLKHVAETIRSKFSSEGRPLFRFGGEEFVLILPNASIGIAKEIAENIRSAVESLTTLYQQAPIKCTLSLGVSSENTDQKNWTALLNNAQLAEKKAKEGGRNRVCA